MSWKVRSSTSCFIVAVSAVALGLVAGCCPTPCGSALEGAVLEPPAASGAPRSFVILGTADLQGALEASVVEKDLDGDGDKESVSVGGIARIATIVHEADAAAPGRVVVVSTGDDLMNRYFHVFKGKAIYELMSAAGYDVYAFGNHEFDKGSEVLAEGLAHATFECVCSDLSVAGTPLDGLCEPTLIREVGGVRVGFFSLMCEDFPYVTSAGSVTLAGDNISTAMRAVSELRRDGAEAVVALTHIGEERDREIAAAVPGIDVIFGGHSHAYLEAPEWVGNTVIVNGGEKGTHVVRLDLAVDGEGRIDLKALTYELIAVTGETIEPERATEDLLAAYTAAFPEAVVLGRTAVAWDMTKEAARQGESSVANLVNDHLRAKFRVDIVLNNAGAFRGKRVYEPGPVTDVMLHEIDEFSNYACTLDIPGARILEILERSAACYGEGGFLHPSGLRYTVDLRNTAQVIEQGEGASSRVVTSGSRVTRAEVLGADGAWGALDPDRVYRVLANSFLVEKAGDGYFWLKAHGANVKNTYSTFYSILAELAGSRGTLDPAPPDRRITIVR